MGRRDSRRVVRRIYDRTGQDTAIEAIRTAPNGKAAGTCSNTWTSVNERVALLIQSYIQEPLVSVKDASISIYCSIYCMAIKR